MWGFVHQKRHSIHLGKFSQRICFLDCKGVAIREIRLNRDYCLVLKVMSEFIAEDYQLYLKAQLDSQDSIVFFCLNLVTSFRERSRNQLKQLFGLTVTCFQGYSKGQNKVIHLSEGIHFLANWLINFKTIQYLSSEKYSFASYCSA